MNMLRNHSITMANLSFIPLLTKQPSTKLSITTPIPLSISIPFSTFRTYQQPRSRKSTMSDAKSSQTKSSQTHPLVQYVVIRRDLLDTWPIGSVIAQGVHASVAAVWNSRQHECTIKYCSQNASTTQTDMRTVVLEAKNENELIKLAEVLTQNTIGHVLWREQPENFVTAIATYPRRTTDLKMHFANLKLFK